MQNPPTTNPECTGVAASWCPVHGDCTCPCEEDGSFVFEDDSVESTEDVTVVYLTPQYRRRVFSPDCPLHGAATDHT